ncbi:hypothetical protein [Streptomyces sp. WZ-12]|uniref:hypothetical protein n=1 Tax=Streptomyces sp. WZ-12 TaxID=3030210 RepID=UPI0023810F7D|nr:hypothetical protein [Streptomyces sp. WZ-12]
MARFAEFFPAATDYFRVSSYGRMTYVPKPLFRWIRMSHPLAAYGINRGANFDPSSHTATTTPWPANSCTPSTRSSTSATTTSSTSSPPPTRARPPPARSGRSPSAAATWG